MTKLRNISLATSCSLLLMVGCSKSSPPASAPAEEESAAPVAAVVVPAEESKDIVDTAAEAGQFQTLIAAATAAGLVEALRGDGPLTVFAPTDEAFAKLPEGTVEALLQDPAALAKILKHHVVAGKVMAEAVSGMDSAVTLNGTSLAIDTSDGVKIGAATVIATDVEASNGVIHVIDTVLIPE